jgi:hypothetical protein
MKRLIKSTFGVMLGLCATSLLAIRFPEPFFIASAKAGNLVVYSDRPFLAADGEKILRMSAAQLAASPLFSEKHVHRVFISHSAWRRLLFLTRGYHAGGINYYPLTTNVFLRGADIEANRLTAPSGAPVAGSRTLDYYIAHEITHTLTGRALGAVEHYRLPRWKREGYADYVAKGTAFDFAETARALRESDWRMDYDRSGLYWRDHLLVSYLLDKCRWEPRRLLSEAIDEQVIEHAIRRGTPKDAQQATCENAGL